MTTKKQYSPAAPGPAIIEPPGLTPERALIAGTGIDVFEVYQLYRAVDDDWAELRGAFHWLTTHQLRAALDYAAAHREEMDARLARDLQTEQMVEELWRK